MFQIGPPTVTIRTCLVASAKRLLLWQRCMKAIPRAMGLSRYDAVEIRSSLWPIQVDNWQGKGFKHKAFVVVKRPGQAPTALILSRPSKPAKFHPATPPSLLHNTSLA